MEPRGETCSTFTGGPNETQGGFVLQCSFTKVNTGLFCSSGVVGGVVVVLLLLLLVGLRLVAVGVVVEQGDGCDFAPAHQPRRSDGCAELHDTGGAE